MKIGLSPDEYWRMTVYETKLKIKAYQKHQNEKVDDIKIQSYLTAVYCLSGFGGKLPSLDEILGGEKKEEDLLQDAIKAFGGNMNIIP